MYQSDDKCSSKFETSRKYEKKTRFSRERRPIVKFLYRQHLTRNVASQAPGAGQNSSFFHRVARRDRIRKPAVIVRATLNDDADDDDTKKNGDDDDDVFSL